MRWVPRRSLPTGVSHSGVPRCSVFLLLRELEHGWAERRGMLLEMYAAGISERVSLQRNEVCGDLPAAMVTKRPSQGWGWAGRCVINWAHGRVQSADVFWLAHGSLIFFIYVNRLYLEMGIFQSKSGFSASLENLKSLDTLGTLPAVGDGLGWRSVFSSERTWLSCPGRLLFLTPSCFRPGCFLPGRWGLWACTENPCYCNLLFLGVGRHSFSPLPLAKSFWLTLPCVLWTYSILILLLGLPFRRSPELTGHWVHRATSYIMWKETYWVWEGDPEKEENEVFAGNYYFLSSCFWWRCTP